MSKKMLFAIILVLSFFTIINFFLSRSYLRVSFLDRTPSRSPSATHHNAKQEAEKSDQNKFQGISYFSLYYPAGKPMIHGFEKLKRNELMIKLSTAFSNDWKIFIDNENPYFSTGKYPKLNLLSGLHTYRVIPVLSSGNSDFQLTLKFRYTSQTINRTISYPYFLSYASIPVGKYPQYPIAIWENIDKRNQKDIESARQILSEEAGIDLNADTLTKIEKISQFILARLNDKRGTPSKAIYSVPPLQKYQMAKKGESRIWCRQFAEIYTFFANVAQIPTRTIELAGQSDGILLTGHGFAESYVKESNQWIFIDLTSNIIFLKNSTGDLLNALDLYYINLTKSYEGIAAHVYKNGNLIDVPFSTVSLLEQRYFKQEVGFIYYGKQGKRICSVLPCFIFGH